VQSTAPITAPSFEETDGICAIVAVVDTLDSCGRAKPLRGECTGGVAGGLVCIQSWSECATEWAMRLMVGIEDWHSVESYIYHRSD
jgi:hypothetical protein